MSSHQTDTTTPIIYSGEEWERVVLFFDIFELHSRRLDWLEGDKVYMVAYYLTNKAYESYRDLFDSDPAISWNVLKKEMIRIFRRDERLTLKEYQNYIKIHGEKCCEERCDYCRSIPFKVCFCKYY